MERKVPDFNGHELSQKEERGGIRECLPLAPHPKRSSLHPWATIKADNPNGVTAQTSLHSVRAHDILLTCSLFLLRFRLQSQALTHSPAASCATALSPSWTGQLQVRNWSAVSPLPKSPIPGRTRKAWQLVQMAGHPRGKRSLPLSPSMVLGKHATTPGVLFIPTVTSCSS